MTANTLRQTKTIQAGQIVSGTVITFVIIGAITLLAHLPWGWTKPVTSFIANYPLLNAFVSAFIVANVVALQCLVLIWIERKFAGWMQARVGPMHVGWKGTLQTVADAVKLLLKEDIVPADADVPMFALAPYLVFIPSLLTFMVLPFTSAWVGFDYSLGALFVLSISALSILGVFAAGWGSNNKYSLLGGMRAVAQLLSYDIPLILSVLSVVMLSGTLSLTKIVEQQSSGWNIVRHPFLMIPAFVMFIICTLAEVNRTPFDLPEAESELVSGFHTEYSGMRFAFFFLAEFANNFFSGGLAATLFFGGWLGAGLPAALWFTLKTLLVICLMMWIRWTLPRLRVDQMMSFCWKILVPAGMALICATALATVGH